MYIGFELKKIDESFFNDFKYFLNIGNRTLRKHKGIIQDTLDKFENYNGSLDGDKMQSNWFPQINADIFLSHSHADENLVIAFGGWLKEEFGLECFIDSCIWGYSKSLQNIIDNTYSRNREGVLDYDSVLYASSHVNMMLNTALMQMVDSCECIIFVNTPKSVKPNQVMSKIISPWIYSEIAMTKLIKSRSLDSYRIKSINENRHFSELEIEYNLDTKHLLNLTTYKLHTWKNAGLKNSNALDYLYRMFT
ncbi:MAG TPA: hypothetical protein DCQ50_10185 [Chryseobacterium sp.]|nr:hypothetical protein [Chryseobacterium sp.]